MMTQLFFALVIFIVAASDVLSETLVVPQPSEVLTAYRSYVEVEHAPTQIPTVVELPVPDLFLEIPLFAVYDTTSQTFEPYFLIQTPSNTRTLFRTTTAPSNYQAKNLVDGKFDTFADFELPKASEGLVEVTLASDQPVTSSKLTIGLAPRVALPTSVKITAEVNGQDIVVFETTAPHERLLQFPQITSDLWKIRILYSQPLRLSEISLQQEQENYGDRSIRFLSQPEHEYRVYMDPDRAAAARVGEVGNFASESAVLTAGSSEVIGNSFFTLVDSDSDTISDIQDNCVSVANVDQLDVNKNKRGDSCDDFDFDGLQTVSDNCPDKPNRDQKDSDSDDIGDVCDRFESRLTEKYPWLPWVGIGIAGMVIAVLFGFTAHAMFESRKVAIRQSEADSIDPPLL